MKTTGQIAKHFKEVYFGGNWTVSNIKDTLEGTTWQVATHKVQNLNTIATLAFHINYFVCAATQVLQGEELNSKDELSFNHPPIQSQKDWDGFLEKILKDAEIFTGLIEKLPQEKLKEDFTDKKYGNYYRNLHGIIEHAHYHLGQIAIIKKMILQSEIK